MVARTPLKQRKMVAPLNPVLIRETINKVDKCVARLQELQYTVTGGTKVIGGVNLSPRSTRGYIKTSTRCKQESLRMKNGVGVRTKSPVGKFPASTGGEWRRMSLPAMLLSETVEEILQASRFAKKIVAAIETNSPEDPKTPLTEQRKKQRPLSENTELKSRRNKEKQNKMQQIRSESEISSHQRARSRINFKVSPPKKGEFEKANTSHYIANRVSPKHKPWVKKTVLFPNPLFLSTNSASQKKSYCKTTVPPHKFLIKSPLSPGSKFHVKIKSPPLVSISPTTRPANLSKKSPSLSKFSRSFSPSKFASRLVSPLKSRKNVLIPKQFSARRI